MAPVLYICPVSLQLLWQTREAGEYTVDYVGLTLQCKRVAYI